MPKTITNKTGATVTVNGVGPVAPGATVSISDELAPSFYNCKGWDLNDEQDTSKAKPLSGASLDDTTAGTGDVPEEDDF